MGLVVQGMLNKQIGAQLGTAEITVKIQRGRIMKKMGVNSVADLVRMAEKIGQYQPAVGSKCNPREAAAAGKRTVSLQSISSPMS
ncbi:MAG: Nitrogen regulation protein [Lacunisphaera sp.]|nr:Nitrogen regulation protein [Lacunisphaera sp.]